MYVNCSTMYMVVSGFTGIVFSWWCSGDLFVAGFARSIVRVCLSEIILVILFYARRFEW